MMNLEGLNENQKLGVTSTEGPVLILAGAGSGKTRVITHRAAYLIEEKGVNPYNIMAITFTNKAAGEMRDRINKMVGIGAEAIWVSTFHASCVRILRRYIDRIGYDTNFTIYDTDDSKKLMKQVLSNLNIDSKKYKEKMFLNVISDAKNELINPEQYLIDAHNQFELQMKGRVYREYQALLKANNALDFDDLIMKTVELFRKCSDVLEGYHNRLKYIMVDEYQDTNTAQFELVRLLAAGSENLCVVGDDDQSIYKFRGANIYNILNFEKHYPNATVIKLEENYRSTSNILEVANSVISNNSLRKEKKLWTEVEGGEKVKFLRMDSAFEEADYIAKDISKLNRMSKYSYKDSAILYRTNAQSRILEEKLINEGVPYKIIGGTNFYSRREIKDLIAYLKCISNPNDDLAILRIINVPKRGIGNTTISKIQMFASDNNISFRDAIKRSEDVNGLSSATLKKVKAFYDFIEELDDYANNNSISELIEKILEETEYIVELVKEGSDESKDRIENIDELISKVCLYEDECRAAGKAIYLDDFLTEVSLVADIDQYEEDENYVVLMTLHGAKGLEFPNVYIPGMEENLFPSGMSIGTDEEEEAIEEERRLCYVGITRAMEKLTLISSASRMSRGQTNYNAISRFIKEIPASLLDGNVWEPKSKDTYKPSNSSSYFMKQNKKPMTTYQTKNFGSKIEKKQLEYGVGDRVKHVKFGEGEVVMINDGGRDYEVTVLFDKVGSKKMFASFAKLVKL